MKKYVLTKIGVFIIILASVLGILVSCNRPPNTSDKTETGLLKDLVDVSEVQPIEDKKKEDESTDLNWKTEEIFDVSKYRDELTIRFFHTGVPVDGSAEGDLILIITPDGVTMLIDAGLPACGPILVEFLDKLNIKKLDYAVATHMHVDHIGGYIDVLNNVEIGKMIVPNFTEYNTSLTKNFLATLDTKQIPMEIVKKGDTFKLGEHVDIEILGPEWDVVIPEGTVPEKSPGFVNNYSLVMKMVYKENRFLFTGDIYWEREDILVAEQEEKLKVDLLKVPHHGSHTSSSIKFVQAVEPEIAIMTSISPNKDVYNRYKRKGSELYITGLDGNILAVSNGKQIRIIQEHNRTIKGYYD